MTPAVTKFRAGPTARGDATLHGRGSSPATAVAGWLDRGVCPAAVGPRQLADLGLAEVHPTDIAPAEPIVVALEQLPPRFDLIERAPQLLGRPLAGLAAETERVDPR